MEITKSSILAGMLIGLAGYIYLTVGGIVGAFMFLFGLLGVCYMGLHLYTGKAGSCSFNKFELSEPTSITNLFLIILFNIIGTVIVSYSIPVSDTVLENLEKIHNNRANVAIADAIIRSIFCGLIMEIAVYMYRYGKTPLGAILGVPLFILCGFYHCVADSFYLSLHYFKVGFNDMHCYVIYGISIIGNLVGCNIRRLLMKCNNGE